MLRRDDAAAAAGREAREMDLFLAAVELPRDEWGDHLARACAGEPSLCGRVERLLRSHAAAEARERTERCDALPTVEGPSRDAYCSMASMRRSTALAWPMARAMRSAMSSEISSMSWPSQSRQACRRSADQRTAAPTSMPQSYRPTSVLPSLYW